MGNMFDDGSKKKREEAAARVRNQEEKKAERVQVAQSVCEELMTYVGTHPRPGKEDLEIGIHHNVITLQGKKSRNKLTISCEDQGLFVVKTESGGPMGPVDQNTMTRTVTDWLAA
jgi:hypothetical protein